MMSSVLLSVRFSVGEDGLVDSTMAMSGRPRVASDVLVWRKGIKRIQPLVYWAKILYITITYRIGICNSASILTARLNIPW